MIHFYVMLVMSYDEYQIIIFENYIVRNGHIYLHIQGILLSCWSYRTGSLTPQRMGQ